MVVEFLKDNVLFFLQKMLICQIEKSSNANIDKIIDEINDTYEDIADIVLYQREDGAFSDYIVDGKSIFPTNGGICITNACQLRCNYCSFSSDESKKTVDQNDAKIFINFLVRNAILKRLIRNEEDCKIDLIITGGGEPTFRFNVFADIVNYVKDKCSAEKIPLFLNSTTNGIINKEQQKFILNNFNFILVSFDGLPETQNKNRQSNTIKNSFTKVNDTLKFFNDNKMRFGIRTTIWPDDYSKIIDMVDFIYSEYPNAELWDIEPIIPRGRALVYNSDICSSEKYLNTEFAHLYIEAKNYIKLHKDKDILSCSKFNGIVCGTLFGMHPWLLPSGDIVTCQDAKENAIRIGKIQNGSLSLQRFKDIYAEECFNNIVNCKDCFAFPFCLSGCPLKNLSDESTLVSIQECNMIKNYWKEIFITTLIKGNFLGWKATEINNISAFYKIFRLEKEK